MTSILPVQSGDSGTPIAIGVDAAQGCHLHYLAGLRSDQSRRSMGAALRVLAKIVSAGTTSDPADVPWHELRNEHSQAVATTLAERFAPSTARQRLSAFRGVLRAAWRAGLLDQDRFARLIDVEPIRGSREPKGRALTSGELRSLFASCAEDTTPVGARDAAALALMVGAGLRRTEAIELNVEQVDLHAEEMRVLGKGNKERTVPIANGTLSAVIDWIEIRGEAPGPLLITVDRGGHSTGNRLTGDALLRICQRRASRAGVKLFSPHDLRRTFASELLDAGGDIAAVQALMGHANIATTQRYDRRGDHATR
jgi:site-specific recombinase XerD